MVDCCIDERVDIISSRERFFMGDLLALKSQGTID